MTTAEARDRPITKLRTVVLDEGIPIQQLGVKLIGITMVSGGITLSGVEQVIGINIEVYITQDAIVTQAGGGVEDGDPIGIRSIQA